MWQYELLGMAAAIWPALLCLIAPPYADPTDDLQGKNGLDAELDMATLRAV